MTEADHIHFGAEFYWNYLAKKNEKRSKSDPPILGRYIRHPVIKIGLRHRTAHRVNGSRSRSIKKEGERELCGLNSSRRIRI